MPQAILTITFTPETGQVQVNGPIQDKVFCYGMLESAKDAIRDYVSKKSEANRIITPELRAQLNITGNGKGT